MFLCLYFWKKRSKLSHFGPIAEMSRLESALHKKRQNPIKTQLEHFDNMFEDNTKMQYAGSKCNTLNLRYVQARCQNFKQAVFCGVLILSHSQGTCSSAHLINQLISDIRHKNNWDNLGRFLTKNEPKTPERKYLN